MIRYYTRGVSDPIVVSLASRVPSSSRVPAASRARVVVLTFAFLLAAVTYLDRVCISAAAPFISDDLRLTTVQMGQVLSAFALAYSLFEIPSGWLGDLIGPRRVLTRIVLWWSAFTMLTGAAAGYPSLIATRFLFGAGEAGAFPNMSRSLSRWFPQCERGKANGVMFFGSRVGGMLSAPIALLLINRWGWRASFVIVGALGLVWAAAWFVWYRDRPSDHPAVSANELAWIEQDSPKLDERVDGWVRKDGQIVPEGPVGRDGTIATPWRALLHSRNLYAICAMYFTYGYGLYFYFTWLPTYLIRVLGFSVMNGGLLAGLPFLCAGIANLAGGWLTDALARDRGLRTARCGLGFSAFFAGAALTFASTLVPQAMAKAVLLALALGSVDLALGACWAVCLDIGRDHAGVVTGCMNTFSNLGGVLTPLVVAYAVDRWGSWTFPFYVTAVVYAAGALIWLVIDPEHPIVAGTVGLSASGPWTKS
jgi:ACS family glucarate transporter-like MFS transporter